jgi:hypothetical protein
MMWIEDAADEPVFAHEQTNILGATCLLSKAMFRAEQRAAWNERFCEAQSDVAERRWLGDPHPLNIPANYQRANNAEREAGDAKQ